MSTHWNHRVVKRVQNGITYYQLHEVYYTDGRIIGVTQELVAPLGETTDELKKELERMIRACDTPILDYDELP